MSDEIRFSTLCGVIGGVGKYLLDAANDPGKFVGIAFAALISGILGAAGKHFYDILLKPAINLVKHKILSMLTSTTLQVGNSGKQSPKWFRKFKKIYTNLESAALALAVYKWPQDSATFAFIKIGSSTFIENLETLLADADDNQSA